MNFNLHSMYGTMLGFAVIAFIVAGCCFIISGMIWGWGIRSWLFYTGVINFGMGIAYLTAASVAKKMGLT